MRTIKVVPSRSESIWFVVQSSTRLVSAPFIHHVETKAIRKHGLTRVTHFVEVLILNSDPTDGITGLDEFLLQSLLLLDTDLKRH